MIPQFKLEVTELTDTSQGIVETTHTFWFALGVFSTVRDEVADMPPDASNPRPHPHHHQFKFCFSDHEELYNPASDGYETMLYDTLPDLQSQEDALSGRIHWGY